VSEGRRSGIGWPWILGVALLGLLGVLAYLMVPTGDSAWGEPGDELAERRASGGGTVDTGRAELRAPEGEEPPVREVPQVEPETEIDVVPPVEPPEFDPEALAPLLFDGGRPPEGEELAEPADEPYIPGPPEEPVRMGPTAPETRLRRVEFWRDLLDQRVEAMRREAEAAREAGDAARLRRAERMLERLEAQRPGVNRRVRELEAELPPR
jgi:hypothetical protein